MATTAYLRVSTTKQDVDNQKLEILGYANSHGMTIDHFVEIEMSSRKSNAARGIDDLLESLKHGDTLIVSELSRLGRSLGGLVGIVELLKTKSVTLVAIKQGVNTSSSNDMASKCILYLSAMFAELERDFISQRTKNGLERALANGKKLGRKKGSLGKSKLDGRVEEIKHLLSIKVSIASIAKIMGISRQALYSYMTSRKLIQTAR